MMNSQDRPLKDRLHLKTVRQTTAQENAQGRTTRKPSPEAPPEEESFYQEGSPLSYLKEGLHNEDILLGDGFLERGSTMMLIAQSGVGKSSAAMQACCCWACGKSAFDFQQPADKPLSIVMIQNEDSRNDLYRQSLVLGGMGFDLETQELIDKNFRIITLRGKLGPTAVMAIRKILDTKSSTDLLVINPMSAYAKGDLTKPEDCVEFLYGQFSPLLDDYHCGGWLLQHTPKMTGGRRAAQKEWTSYDYMYSGAGAATITNYARGIVTIDSIGNSQTFAWRVAKRIRESGWPTETQFHKWHVLPTGCRLWVPASVADTREAQNHSSKKLEDLYKLVPAALEPIPKKFLMCKAMDEEGFTRRQYEGLLDEALNSSTPEDLRLYQWDIYNPEGGHYLAICRRLQPEDEKPDAVKARIKREKEEAGGKIVNISQNITS
jgi:hypothetical protein